MRDNFEIMGETPTMIFYDSIEMIIKEGAGSVIHLNSGKTLNLPNLDYDYLANPQRASNPNPSR